MPTGYEVGVLKAGVSPGDVVAVVGTGPVGLAAIMGARLFSPSHIVAIDHADLRLDAAKQLGADVIINNSVADSVAVVRSLTGGLGAADRPAFCSPCGRKLAASTRLTRRPR
ncbi:MAG TPA: zinc-binding dehydrogenase [Streptosporangiaceae bacterium]|jgi:alcohol dehydrogenase